MKRWTAWSYGWVLALSAACAAPSQGSSESTGPAADEAALDAAVLDAAAFDGAATDGLITGDDVGADALGDDAASRAGADAGLTDLDPPDGDLGKVEGSGGDVPASDVPASDTAQPKPPPSQAELEAVLDSGAPQPIADVLITYDMPVCTPSACTFLVFAPAAKSVDIMGDWAAWTAPAPMKAVPALAGLFRAKVSLDASHVREYKLKIDGSWALDPSNPHFRFAGLGPNSAIYPPGSSRLRRVAAVQSPQLGNVRDLYIYLPAAYFANLSQHFSVMYWHDGFNVFSNPKAPFGDWKVDQISDQLMASGAMEPVIHVGVDTDDRMSEYVWGPLDDGTVIHPPKIDKYAAFLVETVKPLVDKTLRTLPDRDHTAIGGSSLGGNASLWIAWQHWQVFGRLASFSGALWVGEEAFSGSGKSGDGVPMRQLIAENTPKVPAGALRVWLDSGDTDFGGAACYECDSWAYSDWTRNALIKLGWDSRPEWDTDAEFKTPPQDLPIATPVAKVPALAWAPSPPTQPPSAKLSWSNYLGLELNLASMVGHGQQHNEGAWNQRAPAALRYLFPGPKPD